MPTVNERKLCDALLKHSTLLMRENEKLAKAVEKMDKKTGKWNPLPLVVGGEGQTGKLNLSPGDGEFLKVMRAGKK